MSKSQGDRRINSETLGLGYGFLGVLGFSLTLPATRVAVAEFEGQGGDEVRLFVVSQGVVEELRLVEVLLELRTAHSLLDCLHLLWVPEFASGLRGRRTVVRSTHSANPPSVG